MHIPKKVTVDSVQYVILKPSTNRTLARGTCNYTTQTIRVYQQSKQGRGYSAESQAATFWHELTHVILYSMGSELERDEEFVEAFSSRLASAIQSAEF